MRGLYPETDLPNALKEKARGRPARQQPGRGGKVHVPFNAVLGWQGGCWCGQHHSHDWPGKADGAPHPRYPE